MYVAMDNGNGVVSGKRYFQCEPGHGLFARITDITPEDSDGTS